MKSAYRIVVSVLLGLVALNAYLKWGPHEPAYDGHSLSWWLKKNVPGPRGNGVPNESAAIRHLGTNALPTLLKFVRARDPDLRQRAHWAYVVLGPAAKPQVPELIEILTNTMFSGERVEAAHALACIGPDAAASVPALVEAAWDHDKALQDASLNAVLAIEGWGLGPVLMALHDPDEEHQAKGARIIGVLGLKGGGQSQMKAAAPVLLRILSANPKDRKPFEDALKKIDPEAAAKAGIR